MAKQHLTGAHAPVIPKTGVASLPQYAELSITARYLTTLAEKAGLTISHDCNRWMWSGTVEQHRTSGVWAASQCWTFKGHRKAWTSLLLAVLSRDRSDPNIVHAAIVCFHDLKADGRVLGPLAERAKADRGHRGFMARTLAAVDISGDEIPEASPSPAPQAKAEPATFSPDDPRVRLAGKVLSSWTNDDFRRALFINVDKQGKAHMTAANLNDREVLGLLAQMSARVAREIEERECGEGDEA